jgi:DNA-directed RNA polymerase specialized sigma24 family protein
MRVSVQVEQLEDVKSSEPNPESQAMASQSGRSVMLALATVPAEQRMVLELAYFAG